MIADLHCHYVPPAMAAFTDLPIAIAPLGDGQYRFTSDAMTTTLEAGLFDLELQAADARRQGVALRALAPPPFLLQYELSPADGLRWSRAFNDGIAAAVRAQPALFAGFASVPLQDVAAAVAELERAVGELGLRGVEIATHINGVELDAPALDPFWERTERLRTPILVHPHAVAGAARMGDYYLRNLVGNPTDTALAGARLLFGGVLERYPRLRVILSHGGGTLPALVGRLGHGYAVRPEARERAQAPLDHLRRLYYDTVVFDAGVLRHLVATVGAGQVVLGTDYPFDMGEPDPVGFIKGAGLADDAIETILQNGEVLLEGV